MTQKTERNESASFSRIGLISRIDYCSPGFRQALLELVADVCRKEDIHYLVLAGGLISARDHAKQLRKAAADVRGAAMRISMLLKEKPTKPSAAEKIEEQIQEEQVKLRQLKMKAETFDAEHIAEQLAARIPHFENAKGKPIKMHIILSPAYDRELGDLVAQQLVLSRKDDIRVYKPGTDRLQARDAGKEIEVLTATLQPWMRGSYQSTPVARLIEDEEKRASGDTVPDIQFVGCFGTTLTKPIGEAEIPFVSAMALHNIQGVTVAENQVGMRVIDLYRDRKMPIVRTYNFKDLTNKERTFIVAPDDLTPAQEKIVEVLKVKGQSPVSQVAQETNLSRKTAEDGLQALVRQSRRQLKTWPGVIYYDDSHRWDFSRDWMAKYLRYPTLPDQMAVDSMVAAGCIHAGGCTTDYPFFLDMVPKAMLDREANLLVIAGDSIEGLKHNLTLRGEAYPGLNYTLQEELAGIMFADVLFKVFAKRFTEAYNGLLGKSKRLMAVGAELVALINATLPTCVYIVGNHDEWQKDHGITPLVHMETTLIKKLGGDVEELLRKLSLSVPHLRKVLEKKVVFLSRNKRYNLPSGLKMAVLHPYMARAKTFSLRLQEMMGKARDCQVVVGANFHVALHFEMYRRGMGQVVGLELGTLKHGTDFEDTKLKTVDHGFAYLRVESVNRRVLKSECSFYQNEVDFSLDPMKPYYDLLASFGLSAA